MAYAFLVLAIPPMLLVPAMGFLSRTGASHNIGAELRRKALHVGVGLTALSFPVYLSESWMVCAALAGVIGWMIAVRRVPALRGRFGACLHGVERVSYGEIYFALAIAGLILASSGRPLLYVIPLLVLTLADAAAAIVGRMVPLGPLPGRAAGKTASGSAAFMLVAFVVTLAPLSLIADMPVPEAAGIALALAAVTAVIEALSRRGLDNILVPAGAFAALSLFGIPQAAGSETVAMLRQGITTLVAGG